MLERVELLFTSVPLADLIDRYVRECRLDAGKPAGTSISRWLARAGGGLLPLRLPDGRDTSVPALPFSLGDSRLGPRSDPPAPGQHDSEVPGAPGFPGPPGPVSPG